MVYSLMELISFESVADEAEGDAPFGKEVQRAFEYMLNKAEKDEFVTQNIDNYGGHIDYTGASKDVLGIPVHLDVVPAGDGWDYEPFGGEVKDGNIYGRGTTDNKGPAIAVYYAMKALKESGFVPNKKVRLILGLDEETNWVGMRKYMSKVEEPDIGFVPDADFPVINGEMGILVFEIAKKLSKGKGDGIELRSLIAGNAPNMVADHARAVLRAKSYESIRAQVEAFRENTGYDIKAKGVGKSLEIVIKGISSHGAKPEKGLNAISIMMSFLGQLALANDGLREFVEFYNTHIGFDLHGERVGLNFEDETSGKLIFNVGQLNADDEAVMLTVNIRYPVSTKSDEVYAALKPAIDKYNLGVVKIKDEAPIYFPEDHELIRTLMEVYSRYSEDENLKPLVIGGGTYARAVKNTVAFGARFPGEPEYAHQKNEHISIDALIKISKIYADSIYELTNPNGDSNMK